MSFFHPYVATTPTYTGLQFQTSSGAIPIPIVYGITKIAPNALWTGNFQAYYAGGKQSGGNKGGAMRPSKGQAPNDYSAAVIFGLCEGPITAVRSVWENTTITGLDYVLSMRGQQFFPGTTPQTPWNYLESAFPSQALSYGGTAYVADYAIDLGSSATLSSYSFELLGVLADSGFNGNDADPAQVVWDFLTNPQYGVGFPGASIDQATLFGSGGDPSFQSYCRAIGLAFSPAIVSQEPASSILARWLQLMNIAAVWSSGVLKFIPYGDTEQTGPVFQPNSGNIGFGTYTTSIAFAYVVTPAVQIGTCTFVPNVTPVYNLTDDDYIHSGNVDPVQVSRIDPYAAYNMQYLEIYQRTNFYDATPVAAWDQNAIEEYQLRIAPTVTAHEICDPTIAQTSAQLILQRGLYIRKHFTWKCSWEYCLLEPMDLVTLTDANLGLVNTPVRITDVEEGTDGILTFTAEEFPAGVAHAVAYPVQSKTSSAISINVPASPVNAPIIFEPPYGLAGGLFLYAAVSGQVAQTWGGCYLWFSTDGTSYTQLGKINGPATTGVTTQDLPAVASNFDFGLPTVDSAHVLAVDLSQSDSELNPASQSDMLSGASACFVGAPSGPGEVVAYQNAQLTSASNYALGILQRGTFDSIISDHPARSTFAALNNQIFKRAYQPAQIGETVYLKFQSFNAFGAGLQDLDACVAYPYTITGSPLLAPLEPPQNLVISYGAGPFANLSWDEITDPRGTPRYLVKTGASIAVAQQCAGGDVAHPPFVLPQGIGTYYVQSYIVPYPNITVTSDFSEGIEIAGTMLVINNLDSFSQAPENWPGTAANMTVVGNSPDQSMQLAGATSVDLGNVADTASIADDFGSVTDDVIAPLDLGTV
ncbi:phage tail protein [Methylovirgula sp. HY1]|uniref:phage tail protein n=1 Tax=Methylovirgula sp. HY1 TaxID=2822761 RepID=UPI001C5A7D44|nr:phage tail protein [Methylovirgula sp. HY1]QXX74230.1 hypothetical protein MHY1_01040 [Methylovirgula sp. HY1]